MWHVTCKIWDCLGGDYSYLF